jgi:hypothetical protein
MYGMFEGKITYRNPNFHRNDQSLDLQRQAKMDTPDPPEEPPADSFSFPSVSSLPWFSLFSEIAPDQHKRILTLNQM